jgi:serine protease
MKRIFTGLFLLAIATTALSAPAELLSPELQIAVRDAGTKELLDVIVFLEEEPDYQALTNEVEGLAIDARREMVVRGLKNFTTSSQHDILSYLESQNASHKIGRIRSLWVNNTIPVTATKDVILALAEMPGVRRVALDVKRPVLLAQGPTGFLPPVPTREWNITLINAPAVWALGFTGAGIVVGHFDTGVNYTHVDLADHLWINSDETPSNGLDDDGNGYIDDYYGYDFASNDSDPRDGAGHGTHTAGTVASDGTAGDSCGVAPDAQIMSLKVLDDSGNGSESDVWEAIQYAIDNGARVMTFSIGWMHSWSPDRTAWRNAFESALAAGLVAAVAAGNEGTSGPAPDNVRTPGDVPPPWLHPDQSLAGGLCDVVTVGATNSGDAIASFSSRGPVTWQSISPWLDYPWNPEMGLLDPDVSAPGVDVTSCAYYNNTGYLSGYSGTSMACPHVAGLMALMLSKNPTMSPAQVDQIIETTAVDLGAVGKDNTFGAGRINCLDAINLVPTSSSPYIFKQSHVVDDWRGNNDGRMDPGETVDLVVTLRNSGLDANNVQAVLRESDPYVTITDSAATFGNMLTGQTADNASHPYIIVVEDSACDGYQVPFNLYITADGSYENTVSFSLTIGVMPPDFQTHDVGNVRLSVTGLGAFGFTVVGGPGDGFEYPKYTDQLYHGSVAAGNSASYVVDAHFNTSGGDTDWETILCQGLEFGQTVYSDQDGWVRYDDAGHSTPHNLEITQDSWAWAAAPHNDYVIIKYTMKNAGSSALNGMYLGDFADFDMGADYTSNYVGTDPGRRLVYMYSSASGPYVGLKLLDPTTAANLSAIDHDLYVYPGTEMSEQTKINFLNATLSFSQSNRAYDWSCMLSAGPFDLAPGDSEVVAVAILGGNNLSDLQDNADDAQDIYDSSPGVLESARDRAQRPAFALYQNRPNPFSSQTKLEFAIPAGSKGSLDLFDAAGRLVRSFAVGDLDSQRYVVWDGKDSRGREVPSGVYFSKLSCSGLFAFSKMVIAR